MLMSEYPIGTRLLAKEGTCTGTVIGVEELLALHPKIVLPSDICVKWLDERDLFVFASTFDTWWLDENCTILKEAG